MTATGPCQNCGQPVEGFAAGVHDLCGVFCAVMANAPIDGLSDSEIIREFVGALTDAVDADDPDSLHVLQRGVARLLYWLAEADREPGRGALCFSLERFLKTTVN